MLVVQLGTVDQQLSVAGTWLRNTVRADPKELLWGKTHNSIKGKHLSLKF